jgi:SulP family sulfate permease
MAPPSDPLTGTATPRLARFQHDLVAGLAVALVLIPAVLAYADLVRLPALSGLYAALASMLVFPFLTSSRRVIVGPDAAVALIASAAIAPLAGGDAARLAALAGALALLVGAVLVVAARLRIGAIADLLSQPVLIGYLNGAALVLIASQLGRLLGIELHHDEFIPRLIEIAGALPDCHLPTLALGAGLVATLVAVRRLLPRLPLALAGMALGLLAMQLLPLRQLGVHVLGQVPTGLPLPTLPLIGWGDASALMPAALGIAFLVFSDGILLARTFAARQLEGIDANRELIALGAANLAAGLCLGFPVSASQARTVVNDGAGATSRAAQLVAAAALAAFILFGVGLLATLPLVALSAILIALAGNLVDLAGLARLRRLDPGAWWLALATSAGVLLAGVVPGILLGVGMSLLSLLAHIARPRDAVLRRAEAGGSFHDLGDDQAGMDEPGLLVYRLYAPLIFANAAHVVSRLRTLIAGAAVPVRCVIIDAQSITGLDVTAAERVRALEAELSARGVALKIARAKLPLRQAFERLGVAEGIGHARFYDHVKEAVDSFTAARDAGG